MKVNIINVPDFKNKNGQWARTYYKKELDVNVVYHTRSSVLWTNLCNRCHKDSKYRQTSDTYSTAINKFLNFHEFAEWCQYQQGYLDKNPNGSYWALDKDILVKGNKIYSPETCLFVPQKVNNLLTNSLKARGEYPIGVSFHKRVLKFTAKCNDGTKKAVHLGVYTDPLKAHAAWQLYKSKLILDVAKEVIHYNRLYSALCLKANDILDDMHSGRITEW